MHTQYTLHYITCEHTRKHVAFTNPSPNINDYVIKVIQWIYAYAPGLAMNPTS